MVLSITKLWISVENVLVRSAEKPEPGRRPARRFNGETAHSAYSVRACSACAGDYEDPDRTARTDDEEIEPEPSETGDDTSQAE